MNLWCMLILAIPLQTGCSQHPSLPRVPVLTALSSFFAHCTPSNNIDQYCAQQTTSIWWIFGFLTIISLDLIPVALQELKTFESQNLSRPEACSRMMDFHGFPGVSRWELFDFNFSRMVNYSNLLGVCPSHTGKSIIHHYASWPKIVAKPWVVGWSQVSTSTIFYLALRVSPCPVGWSHGGQKLAS